MAQGDVFEIEGGIGELDYGGVTLATADFMVKTISESIVAPEVRRRINTITGETERSIKVKREGFFDPRSAARRKVGIGPTYSVFSDPTVIEHAVILEFGYGGRNAIFRPSARARKVRAGIRNILQLRWGQQTRIQIRAFKRRAR
jgi:hypothetical protein